MILETIEILDSNLELTLTTLKEKINNGDYDDLLVKYTLLILISDGLIVINKDKTTNLIAPSDLNNYVKNTDYTTSAKYGIMKVGNGLVSANGIVNVTSATSQMIDNKTNGNYPITPVSLNYAVKSALSSTNRISDMTDEEKINTRGVIGAISETDYGTTQKAGVVKSSGSFGFGINTGGYGYLIKATNAEIDAGTDNYKPIVPSNLNHAVRSVLPEVQTSLPKIIIKNCIYDLGEQTTLSITLPATGTVGDWLQFDFMSGSTKTTLEINAESGILGFDLIPESNYIYTMYLDWGMIGKNADGSINYGWRFNYSEYPLNS